MNARDLSFIALSVALLSVSAWIALPLGNVMITMQTAVVCFVAGLLGAKRAFLVVLSYLMIGALGVPVFAGFSAGVGRLLAPTGGYLIGFLAIALTVGATSDWMEKSKKSGYGLLALAMLLGVMLCYTLGTIWFVCSSVHAGNNLGILAVLSVCVFPYVPFDIIKILLAIVLTKRLGKMIKRT